MKFLKFVLINILSVYSLVSGEVSNDCTQLSAFLKEKKEWDCCSSPDITCDSSGSITDVQLYFRDYPVESDFTDFPILPKLKYLYLQEYDFDVLPSRIFDLPNLKKLEIDRALNEITNDINPNCPIEELTISKSTIVDVPPNLFKLSKLKKISFINCIDFNAKIVKFGSTLDECHFINSDLSCYEPGTCKSLNTYQQDINECSKNEISNIMNSQSNNVKVDNNNVIGTTNENVSQNNNNNNNNNNNIPDVVNSEISNEGKLNESGAEILFNQKFNLSLILFINVLIFKFFY